MKASGVAKPKKVFEISEVDKGGIGKVSQNLGKRTMRIFMGYFTWAAPMAHMLMVDLREERGSS